MWVIQQLDFFGFPQTYSSRVTACLGIPCTGILAEVVAPTSHGFEHCFRLQPGGTVRLSKQHSLGRPSLLNPPYITSSLDFVLFQRPC